MYLETTDPYKLNFEVYKDSRGELAALDLEMLPFVVKRVFTIKANGVEIIRGGHAHKECWQFLYPSAPGVRVSFLNLGSTGSVELNLGDGLVVPPFNWIEVTIPNESVIVNVLASHSYDKDDYLYNRPNS
jgi:hypothetical protein